MHSSARRTAIVNLVEDNGACSVGELVRRLGVSDETVRRDIKALAAKGLVERVHGGVLKPAHAGEDSFSARMIRNAEAKRAIAELAAAEIQDGDSLMMDTGSTTAFVARALARRRNLFVVTNCTEIGRTLAGGRNNRVYVAGGEIRGDDGAVFGETAVDFLRRFRVRLAVLSAGGVQPEAGLMDYHLPEAEIARAMAAGAAQSMVVADHSKFQSPAPVSVMGFDRIDMLVTDRPPPDAAMRALAHHGVAVKVAGTIHPAAGLSLSRA